MLLASAGILWASDLEWKYPSQVATSFLIATIALPVLWISLSYGTLSTKQLTTLSVGVAFAFLAMRCALVGERRADFSTGASRTLYWPIVTMVVLCVLAYLLFVLGLRPKLFGPLQVYDQRAEYAQGVSRLGSYVVGWLVNGVFPVLLSVGIRQKSPRKVLIACSGIAFLFFLTGFKSFVIGLALTVVAHILLSKTRRAEAWFVTLTCTSLAGALIDLLIFSVVGTSLLVRRFHHRRN